MTEKKPGQPSRTLIFFIIVMPVLGYLLYYADAKNKQGAVRAQRCQEECAAQGYPGFDFRWNVLSQPQCQCLGEVLK